RERYVPPDVSRLSEAARELLRICIAGGCPEGNEANRPAYRELVAARIMMPMGSFSKGDECGFRFTYWGHKLRFQLPAIARPPPTGPLAASFPRHPFFIARAISLARSVIGSSVDGACLSAWTWLPPWRCSSYSCAMIASSREVTSESA